MGLAFLITSENLQLLSERKVLKEAEYAALLDASALVETARQEARRIVRQAQQEADDSRRQGFEEGMRNAKAEYAQRLAADTLVLQRQLHALRTAMAQIVVKAVGQFVGEADPAALYEAALLRVESLVRQEPFITMRVAPGQEAALRLALARLAGGPQGGQAGLNATVLPDPALREGECVVQTASGTLEIGTGAQLEAFRRALEQSGAGLVRGAA